MPAAEECLEMAERRPRRAKAMIFVKRGAGAVVHSGVFAHKQERPGVYHCNLVSSYLDGGAGRETRKWKAS